MRLVEISEKEFTYGRSLNLGAISARHDVIVNLSAHAFPKDSTWLKKLTTPFSDDNVAGVYGRQLSDGNVNPFEAFQNDQFFGPRSMKFNLMDKRLLKRIHFSNSNCAVRKDVWQRFRFNEQVSYAEDILWQMEVLNAGFAIIYECDAAVYHTHEVDLHRAYKNSRDCAYTLALVDEKSRAIRRIIFDVAVFIGLIPNSLLQNTIYVWRRGFNKYLKVVPFFVLSSLFGWLVGRLQYTLTG